MDRQKGAAMSSSLTPSSTTILLSDVHSGGRYTGYAFQKINTRFDPILSSARKTQSLDTTRMMLRGMARSVDEDDPVRITRIEIFRNAADVTPEEYPEDVPSRGTVLYDEDGRPQLHVLDAWIGYDRMSSMLVGVIFDELGIPAKEIGRTVRHEIITRYRSRPYGVVVYLNPSGQWAWEMTSELSEGL